MLESGPTWKTLGALTKEARAEDRVAEKIPAEMIGEKPETKLITWKQIDASSELFDIYNRSFRNTPNIFCS